MQKFELVVSEDPDVSLVANEIFKLEVVVNNIILQSISRDLEGV